MPDADFTPDSAAWFISDMHLGADYMPDGRDHERRVCDFLHSIAPRCKRLFIVGDALDYWFEYRTVVPRGFVRFFGQLAAMADAGTEIIWLTGNHDIWLFDYLRDEIGLRVVDGAVRCRMNGKEFFIAHGDGLGPTKASFRFIRALFRNRLCQKLYSGIHPRWTVGFAHWWSAGSRGDSPCEAQTFDGEMRRGVLQFAEQLVNDYPEIDYIVLGHHHVAVDQLVGEHTHLCILGDWISRQTYGVFDGKKMTIEQHDN